MFFDANASDENPQDSRLVLTGMIVADRVSLSLPGDLNADQAVDAADAAILFGAWWTAGGNADITGDQQVDAADAGVLFGAWTGDRDPAHAEIVAAEPVGSPWAVSIAILAILWSRQLAGSDPSWRRKELGDGEWQGSR